MVVLLEMEAHADDFVTDHSEAEGDPALKLGFKPCHKPAATASSD